MQNIEAIYDVTHDRSVFRGQNQLIENLFQLPRNIEDDHQGVPYQQPNA